MTPRVDSITLSDLSVLNPPPGLWIMAIIKAYFDDSGDEEDRQHRVCSIAGFVATVETWINFEKAWKLTLNKYDVPYLHMKEFAHFHGPFAKFKKDEKKRIEFLKSLFEDMRFYNLNGITSIIRLNDLNQFNIGKGVQIDAYALNLYTCMAMISQRWPDTDVEVIIDRTNKPGQKKDKARSYAETDAYSPDCGKHIDLHILDECLTFRNIIPLQAADLLAWESRKDIDTKSKLFSDSKTKDDFTTWYKSLFRVEDRATLYTRKSLETILRSGTTTGIIWSYKELCMLDNARNHIWP